MLFGLEKDGTRLIIKERFSEKAASDLGIVEKAIEEWDSSQS